MRPGSLDAASSAAVARGEMRLGTAGPNKSRYRGVSYDKKKRKWRVQIKVGHLHQAHKEHGCVAPSTRCAFCCLLHADMPKSND